MSDKTPYLAHLRSKISDSPWKRSFLVALVFVTLAAGLFWLDAFRGYRAETTVMVIGKSPLVNAPQAAGNLAALPLTLSFYDRLLQENDFLTDPSAGETPDQRKDDWNRTITVARQNGSGVFTLGVEDTDRERAERLAEASARTLVGLSGMYYNVKTDIDVRLVDGPILRTVVPDPVRYVATSVVTGVIMTGIFFLTLMFLPELFRLRPAFRRAESASAAGQGADGTSKTGVTLSGQFGAPEMERYFDPEKFVPRKPATLSYETKEPSVESAPRPAVKTAPAPSALPVVDALNLPVAEADLPFTFETPAPPLPTLSDVPDTFPETEDIVTVSAADNAPPDTPPSVSDKPSEPTVEEYKRRLNELLSGSE